MLVFLYFFVVTMLQNQLLAEQEDQMTTDKNLQKLQEQQLLEQQMKIEELQKTARVWYIISS